MPIYLMIRMSFAASDNVRHGVQSLNNRIDK